MRADCLNRRNPRRSSTRRYCVCIPTGSTRARYGAQPSRCFQPTNHSVSCVIDGKRVVTGDSENVVDTDLFESPQDVLDDRFSHESFSSGRPMAHQASNDSKLLWTACGLPVTGPLDTSADWFANAGTAFVDSLDTALKSAADGFENKPAARQSPAQMLWS